ncbi:Uncharacterised protein [Schaalia odontolytica]|uniref:Uncharacterized protein n=1 Tax=Schaalia odontolytica TaxID=1660 RepID=A0A2X0VSF1_9ACTO|nr:Uncharacterised protein [Schaalia odontolytica]
MCRDDESRVERRPGHRHLLIDNTHAIKALCTRSEAVPANPNDESAGAPDGLLAHQIRVAHNEVEAQSGLQRDVCASIDGDDERSRLGPPPGERLEISDGVARCRHEKNRPFTKPINRRHAFATQDGCPVLRQVVLDGALESGKKRARVGHLDVQIVLGYEPARGDDATIDKDFTARNRHVLSLAQRHDVLAEVVDEGNTRIENKTGTQSSHAAGQRWLGVQDRGGCRLDQRSCTVTVQIRDVNDGDLAALEARCEVLGAVVDAHASRSGL